MDNYNYPCCDEGDEYDASVRCNRCKEWFHFACVDVDDDVAATIWFCGKCCDREPSICELQGSVGRSKIHKHRTRKGTGSQDHTIGKPKNVPVSGKDKRQGEVEEIEKEVEEIEEEVEEKEEETEGNEGEERYRKISKGKSSVSRQSGKGFEKGYTRSDISGCGSERGAKKASSVGSGREAAKKSLQLFDEANARRKRREEAQRKLLELELKAIERDEEASLQRRELESQIEEGSASERDESFDDEGCNFVDKVKNWHTEQEDRVHRMQGLRGRGAVYSKSTKGNDQTKQSNMRGTKELRVKPVTGLKQLKSRKLPADRKLPASTPAQLD